MHPRWLKIISLCQAILCQAIRVQRRNMRPRQGRTGKALSTCCPEFAGARAPPAPRVRQRLAAPAASPLRAPTLAIAPRSAARSLQAPPRSRHASIRHLRRTSRSARRPPPHPLNPSPRSRSGGRSVEPPPIRLLHLLIYQNRYDSVAVKFDSFIRDYLFVTTKSISPKFDVFI
uniref:Uncharacterized protein n=1 Tax=Oryza brachyantha TaxID=4533 RepID=J3LMW4_ORYBR